MQINFYHHTQRIRGVGKIDAYVKDFGKRREVFEIDDDEKLIGCELENIDG